MSYFGIEKRLLLSVSAISSSATQSIGLTEIDVTVFNSQALTQLVSSIGYPTISSSSNQITLQAGWHYLINVRLKTDDASPSATEYMRFFVSDTSNNVISSIGINIASRDNLAYLAQENCIAYINAMASQQIIKIRAQKVNSTGSWTINGTTNPLPVDFKAHILIKAWK